MRPTTIPSAYAYLLSSAAPPAPATVMFVQDVGAIEAVRQISTDRAPLAVLTEQRPGDHHDAARDALAAAALHQHRLITPLDNEWPAGQLAHTSGFCPPLALWAHGDGHLNDLARRSVAIVGTRHPTTYAQIYSMDIAAGLARHGITIWSGGTAGVASQAHRGAYNAQGASVAVLGTGIRNDYPADHEILLGRSPNTLVVSEYNPLTMPPAPNASAHNRLLAALTRACIVIEPGTSHGAMPVVTHAETYGVPILAFPGPVSTLMFRQAHDLIRAGRATLISDAEHVLECVPVLTPNTGQTPDETMPEP
ncbi:DNA processing protein DprA [Amycolatopsis alba]|uniref:DNA processing protein DprA n=1 Tax=Amycolatopsis alba DSM 44262 TaxID=1125972 RepID=A0A229RM72_AMYAL|nr:DNA processing protein DprA [Amycolatopsis alba]OXM47514.1 DNA processing protein DprA [Amycolatopsis alba DSM 44262]